VVFRADGADRAGDGGTDARGRLHGAAGLRFQGGIRFSSGTRLGNENPLIEGFETGHPTVAEPQAFASIVEEEFALIATIQHMVNPTFKFHA
jgi:hypothetical protein